MILYPIHESPVTDLSVGGLVLVGVEHPGEEGRRSIAQGKKPLGAPDLGKPEVLFWRSSAPPSCMAAHAGG